MSACVPDIGNDEEGEAKTNVPVKTVDKASTRTTKRNVEPEAPVRGGATGGNRRGGPGGNEGGTFSHSDGGWLFDSSI